MCPNDDTEMLTLTEQSYRSTVCRVSGVTRLLTWSDDDTSLIESELLLVHVPNASWLRLTTSTFHMQGCSQDFRKGGEGETKIM